MVIDENKLQVKKYDIPYLEESKRYEESESDDYNPPAVVPAKARGFLPRLRRSLCLLNPMPGMKFRSSQSFKTSHKGTLKAPSDEVRRPKKAVSGPLIHYTDKHTLDAINNHRFDYGVVKNQQRPFRQSYSGELPTTNRSSPYRNSHSGGVWSERPASPPLRQAIKFIGIPKIVQNFKAYNKGQKNDYLQPSLPAEKSLHIDSINTVLEYANFRPSYSETRGKVQDESKTMKRSNNTDKASGREAPSFSDVKTRKNSNVNSNMNPPLPRCPSEPWLWRTLPSRSTSPHARKVSQVTSCTKWENSVLFAAS